MFCFSGVCQATRAVAVTSANGEENEEKGQESEGYRSTRCDTFSKTTRSDYAHCSIRHSTCGFPHSCRDRQEVAE